MTYCRPRLPDPRQLALLSLLLLSALLLNGCSASEGTNGCEWISPIGWSEQDTSETIHEITIHNTKWMEFCDA